ncbi:MAG TPA: family 10 glycosylhydrolase [Armatimonadota bacterium]|nr:family 10 glycosylhydrolase [Armatimonadota bacterium]
MSTPKIATWLHSLPRTPEAVRATVQRLADAGVDLLIPCVKQTDGLVDYPSVVANVRPEYQGWDALMIAAEEANRRGLAIHAWCCDFVEGTGSRLLAEHPECRAVQHGRATEGWSWACPRRPETQEYLLAIYRELIDRYPVQGVHLDYVRYADGFCYCDACRESYQRETGRDLLTRGFDTWQQPDAHDMDAWIAWRCAPVTAFVRAARAAAAAGGKALSAAVFPYLPGQLQDVGQDWEGWLAEGLLDDIMPMTYSMSTRIAAEWTRNHRAAVAAMKGQCRLWEGLVRHRSWSAERFLRHVQTVAAQGVDGICIFDEPNVTDADLAGLGALGTTA